MEKIKRDKNRVDIAKNEIEDISGGYILKVDRPPELDPGEQSNHFFTSKYIPENDNSRIPIHFLFEYPKIKNITDEQKKYISDYIRV